MSKHLSNTKLIIAITIVMLIFSAFMIMPDAEEAAADPGEDGQNAVITFGINWTAPS